MIYEKHVGERAIGVVWMKRRVKLLAVEDDTVEREGDAVEGGGDAAEGKSIVIRVIKFPCRVIEAMYTTLRDVLVWKKHSARQSCVEPFTEMYAEGVDGEAMSVTMDAVLFLVKLTKTYCLYWAYTPDELALDSQITYF